jgi:predicted 2-oxoglutarate/Fe(II)-dependent dioxygenase YbiX
MMPSTDRAGRPATAERSALLILDDFLDPATCAGLCADIDAAPLAHAPLIRKDHGRVTDREARRTQQAAVPADAVAAVEERLAALAPVLTLHFGSRLSQLERPVFLRYEEGDFFAGHVDTAADERLPDQVRRRLVSVVVFLNSHAAVARAGSFAGGLLRFLPDADDPDRPDGPIEVRGKAGRLVAFRATRPHEVTPVTQGRRYTVVSWYPARGD